MHNNSFRGPPRESSYDNIPYRNPRYKGKNYDPNYRAKKKNGNQTNQHASQKNYSIFQQQQQQQQQQQIPQFPQFQQFQQQQQQFQQSEQQQQQQQQQEDQFQNGTSSGLLQEFLVYLAGVVDQNIRHDLEHDFRMCDCSLASGPRCFHAITDLYEKHLVTSCRLQHDVVDLLSLLMSRNTFIHEIIRLGLIEYAERNPDTPLRQILDTMGREGIVAVNPDNNT
ncbi:hypothetical protein F5Y12DRAFT_775103 [Xylaria sp. FL1777]|nr:hypothetical protein F5Y12DRAFT_775103 [Xylaria sp. FL1777]